MTAPRRRWSYSLRTLFVVVTALCAAGSWAAYQLNWIRERHAALGSDEGDDSPIGCAMTRGVAPLSLRMLGEPGYAAIYAPGLPSNPSVARLRSLFPEAGIEIGGRFIRSDDSSTTQGDRP